MENKKVYAIDLAIIVGTLAGIILLVGYASPLVIAPIDNLETANSSVLFAFEKANTIWIDDNANFTSPEKIFAENNLVISFKPGTYYWKIEGMSKSEVRRLTILSEVNLKMHEKGEFYELVNAGNTKLNVDVYNESALSGKVVLNIDESKNVSGTKFVGEQNE